MIGHSNSRKTDAKAPAKKRTRVSHEQSRKAREDTRQRLIRCGVELLSKQSLHKTGIEEVLKEASVTKGSFYHYFDSKQDFASRVIDSYAAFADRRLERSFGNTELSPLARFQCFIDLSKEGMAKHRFQHGCLVGNLGQELGGKDDYIADRIKEVVKSWESVTTAVLEEAVQLGEIPADSNVAALSNFFWIGWEGAILWSKLECSARPMDSFAEGFFLAVSTRGPAQP